MKPKAANLNILRFGLTTAAGKTGNGARPKSKQQKADSPADNNRWQFLIKIHSSWKVFSLRIRTFIPSLGFFCDFLGA